MKIFETNNGILYNDECITQMSKYVKNNSVDLVITSPPYNVGIKYDKYDDNLKYIDYIDLMKRIFQLVYNKLKDDGRMAINVPYEAKFKGENLRLFFVSEFWNILKRIGFNWAGLVDLDEPSPHRPKLTAFGSWLSPSAPYIYNPKECVILCYKKQWKKKNKGKSYFDDENKKDFIDLVSGKWKYKPETKCLTKANFSLDFPLNALKILSWENDVVLDPFIGSGTTALACEVLNRKWIGIEISENYCKIASNRLKRWIKVKKALTRCFF